MSETYRIGPLLLDARASVLTEAGAALPLGKRAVAVLAVLVRAAPQYVSKASILQAAWPGVVVEEGNLAVQISTIRRVLRRVSGSERWLETLAGRGYRFVGPVARLPGTGGAATRSNLPEPLTSFIGREREVGEVVKLVAANRLVTLTGAGGVGKTRLATHLASTLLDRYRDGVWLVELGALHDGDLVPRAAMNALGLKEQPGRRLTDTLVEHLRARELLLVLDNAEHLLGECARIVDLLLRHCADVALLVTSRERLGVPGEVTYRVPSLTIPDDAAGASAPALVDYESVRLFDERARLHVPGFALNERSTPAVARICRRLDGIALAIELAAARVRSMSVEEIERRLDRRFELLTGGARTLPPRQQTLRAAVDWSYELLDDAERRLFRAIAVFVGGFTLETAERVCGGDPPQAEAILDRLVSLVDKSLVVADERAGVTRYRLTETVQQYAAERLRESGDEAHWHARHLVHFVRLADEAEAQLKGTDQQAWLDRLEAEHGNFRVALARCMAGSDAIETAMRLASALSRFWLVRGYLAEGLGWHSRLLAAGPHADAAARAKSLNWVGILAWKQGDYRAAERAYADSLELRRALGDRKGVGAVLNNQGLLAYEQGDYRAARTLHEQSLAIDRELGDRWGVAVSLIHLGSLALMQGDLASARSLTEEGLAAFRELGDRTHVANALRSLGSVCSQEGRHAAARALYDESLGICRDLGDRSGIANALFGLGVTARYTGDSATARSRLEDSLRIYRELGDREGTAKSLGNLGRVAALEQDHRTARRLQEESLAIYRELGDRLGLAASVEALAEISSATGEPARAVAAWAATHRLRHEVGAPMPPSERDRHERCMADARSALGDAAFDRAWQDGLAASLDEVVRDIVAGGA